MGPRETILESIAEHKLEFEEPVKNTIIVTLPGIKKLHTHCVLIIGQHSLSINGKRKDITKSDLLVIGESIRCKKASEIIDEINETVSQWNKYADAVQVEPNLRDEINRTLVNINA